MKHNTGPRSVKRKRFLQAAPLRIQSVPEEEKQILSFIGRTLFFMCITVPVSILCRMAGLPDVLGFGVWAGGGFLLALLSLKPGNLFHREKQP